MWVIINLVDVEYTKARATLPKRHRPSVVYSDEELTEQDLLKLSVKFKGQFVMFEAKATTKGIVGYPGVHIVPIEDSYLAGVRRRKL